MPIEPLPGGRIVPHPCNNCGGLINTSRSKFCREPACRAMAKNATQAKLLEIAEQYGTCKKCGGVTTSGNACKACSLRHSRRLAQQAESKRRLTKERQEMLNMVDRRLKREQQQQERLEAGLAPYAKGHGRPTLYTLPIEEA